MASNCYRLRICDIRIYRYSSVIYFILAIITTDLIIKKRTYYQKFAR